MTATDRAPLTPLTAGGPGRAPNRRTGRREVWEAHSADGLWSYVREEGAGTPWRIVYRQTGEFLLCGSLAGAREWTGSGGALEQIERNRASAARPRCTWRGRWTVASCSEPADPETGRCPRHPPGR